MWLSSSDARAKGVDETSSPGDDPDVGDRPESDSAMVRELLGRRPRADFEVVVRSPTGWPVVIRNAPLLDDGTPMPTLYYLVDPELRRRIGSMEADGGVKTSENEASADLLAAAHEAYALERDAMIDSGHNGPKPYGGVGGTRRGVKCLHAHYAYFLAGGKDPIGQWVADRIEDYP